MPAPARATMDFFAAQGAARRRTAVLVVWFALAWAGTIALAWAALALLLGSGVLGLDARAIAAAPAFLPAVAAAVTLVTAGGTAWHGLRLARDGPHAVVEMVGGVPVDRASQDPGERRLVNVVEEMAIAAGLPVPALFVLPGEQGINAFAAGFAPDRAVVAVTRGGLDALSRDELQGVVAHEFSHLLNADAKLNLRLVALVGGITVLALAGRVLVRGVDDLVGDLEGRRSRWRRVGWGRGRVAITAVGLCLWIVGAAGAFFGRLIRAAVSRQREFLADAAAVQFTRNPDGLAGALAKIAERGSAVGASGAPEVSHLFFANGLRTSWLATHPPLDERIRRISPTYLRTHARAAVAEAIAGARRQAAQPPGAAGMVAETVAGLAAAHTVIASVGRPGAPHVAYAAGLLARLPPDVAVAARHPAGARALATALLLDADPQVRDLQAAHVSPDARGDAARLGAALAGASREDRMAILDLVLPSLDGLPRGDAAGLVRDLAALAASDGKTTVFEWALQRVVRRRLARSLGEVRRGGGARTPEQVQVELLELLSALAWLGARDEAGAQAALDAATAAAGIAGRWRPLPRERARATAVDGALDRLDSAALALKARVLAACAACALADGRVAPAEAEVVRAIAASLGLPVPPLAPRAPEREAGAA